MKKAYHLLGLVVLAVFISGNVYATFGSSAFGGPQTITSPRVSGDLTVTGSVGIGSTSPREKLDVDGAVYSDSLTTAKINDTIYVDGTIYPRTSTGIQTAVNAASTGDTLILTKGQYDMTSTVTISTYLNLIGNGRNCDSTGTYLVKNAAWTSGSMFEISPEAGSNKGAVMSDFCGWGNYEAGDGIKINGGKNITVERVNLSRFHSIQTDSAIYLGTSGANPGIAGINLRDLYLSDSGRDITIAAINAGDYANAINITDSWINAARSTGGVNIDLHGIGGDVGQGNSLNISGNYIECDHVNATQIGVKSTGSVSYKMDGNTFDFTSAVDYNASGKTNSVYDLMTSNRFTGTQVDNASYPALKITGNTTTGRIGIGTNSPEAGLSIRNSSDKTVEIVGVKSAATDFRIRRNADSYGLIIKTGQVTGNDTVFNVNNTDALYIKSTGAVSINTTDPVAKLNVKGSGSTSGSTNFLLQNSSNTTLMSVLDNGNVGIGTTVPAQKLEVDGTIYIKGTSEKIKMQSSDGRLWSCQPATMTGMFTCI